MSLTKDEHDKTLIVSAVGNATNMGHKKDDVDTQNDDCLFATVLEVQEKNFVELYVDTKLVKANCINEKE